MSEIKIKLLHAVTEYDRRESKKSSYNRYALPQYIARINEIDADIQNGADIRKAIVAGFSGRLADRCLKAAGLPKTSDDEQRGGWFYQPASGNLR
jgi:hypothetical protein